MFQQKSM